MREKAVLDDIEKYGEILVLEDGRRLYVKDPDEATLASIWLPPARLTIVTARRGGRLAVTNEETGETVLAQMAR